MQAHMADEPVVSEFSALEEDNSLADTIFQVGSEGNTIDFHVLGALFACRSPYFKALLYGRLQEAQPSMVPDIDDSQSSLSTANFVSRPRKFVKMDDISPGAFQYLKSLFYATNPSLNKDMSTFFLVGTFFIIFMRVRPYA